jgi:hypothetical protein
MSGMFGTIFSQLASLVSPRWGDEGRLDLTRGFAALHPWLASLAPLGRNQRALLLLALAVSVSVSVGAGATARAADEDEPDEVAVNDRRYVITDQQFDQLVNRTTTTIRVVGGERNITTTSQPARTQMENALTIEIDYLARECSLSEAQKKKLQLAGRGDIVQFLDRVADLRRKYAGVGMSLQQYQDVMNELQIASSASANFSTFQGTSLFQKTLRKSLNDEQRAQYQVVERNRKIRAIESALATWSRGSTGITLSEESRRKLMDTLVTHGHIPTSQHPYGRYIVMLEIGRLEKLVKPLLTESEWESMRARINSARQLEPTLRRSGQWPLLSPDEDVIPSDATKDDGSTGDKP